MNKYYQIFRLETKERYEPDGYHMKTVETSTLEHVGWWHHETEAEAIEALESEHDGCSTYVILPVYK